MPTVIPFELFLEELKRSEEERKRSEEELKRSKEERKRSEEDLKKFYELLMKEKEQECERLIEKKKQPHYFFQPNYLSTQLVSTELPRCVPNYRV